MPTIKAVALRAGVSVTTVSHTLNHPERVTAQLRERVQQAVDALGYAPNPNARSLRMGRSNLVALILPDICNPFFPELARAIQDELAAAGYDVLIYNSDVPGGHTPLPGQHPFRMLSPKRFDGLLLVGEAVQTSEQDLADLSIPAVYIGNLDKPTIDSVTFDDYTAAYDATAYLIQRGHRWIAHITGDQSNWSGRERLRGFTQALTDHGLAIDERMIVRGDSLRPAGAEGMRVLLQRYPAPTAVFVANGLMAIAALGTALDLGRRVPRDIAIVGYDDIAELADVRPQITTMACSPRALGQAAARLMRQRLEADSPPAAQKLVLPHTLLIRASA